MVEIAEVKGRSLGVLPLGGTGRKEKWSQGEETTVGAEKVLCPLTASPHTVPSVLKKPPQHHWQSPHLSPSCAFHHPTTPPLPLPALPAPRKPLASDESLILLHTV